MSFLVTTSTEGVTSTSNTERRETRERREIERALGEDGVRFERWAVRTLAPDADEPAVLRAYEDEIARVSAEGPYARVDVVRMRPDPSDPTWPERARAARGKFLAEHTHAEDEVRFFVEGRGLFFLRFGERVHIVLCEAGDLISVPAGVRHWFDMGETPRFCAVRFFGTPEGWVASFTGDAIAERFPRLDELAAS